MFIRNDFKLWRRLFFKDLQTSLLNVAGLSTGLACAILIWLWVNDELSIDRFHEKDSRIFQVMKNSVNGDGTIDANESTPGLMADMMKSEMPEVELAAPLITNMHGILTYEQRPYKAAAFFTTADFFKIFSYPLITPAPGSLLKSPDEVFISDKTALKIFGGVTDAVGRSIQWQDEEPQLSGTYKVVGVFTAPPANATRQFDIVFSYEKYFNNLRERYGLDKWYSNSALTFLLLKNDVDPSVFNKKITDYGRKKMLQMHGTEYVAYEGDVYAQQYSSRYLYNRYENGKQAGGRIEYIRLFSIVGICILILACINFMNLATSRAASRVREAGIRKIVGAQRRSLVLQYLGESLFFAFVSLAVALILVQLVLPKFQEITGKQISEIITWKSIGVVLIITTITGLVAGSYPAMLISAFKPIKILNSSKIAFSSRGQFRKALVVVQFSLTILFIISVMVVNKQMSLIQQKDLGFNKNNVMQIAADGKMKRDAGSFLRELRKLKGVVNASAMAGDMTGMNGGGGGISWPGQQAGEAIELDALDVTEGWIETMGITLIEGTAFRNNSPADVVIFNETAIKAMRLKNPVGTRLNMWGRERTIIGVTKDFHYESLYKRPRPMFLSPADEYTSFVVKLQPAMEKATIERISALYKRSTNGLDLEYRFIDEDFAKMYAAEQRVATLSAYFTALAVIISCLGLFGLVSFTVKKREKEISIRKVVGARVHQIAVLLSGDFLKLVFIAVLIALPVGTIVMENWLNNFQYRVNIGSAIYIIAAGIIFLVAMLTITFHSVKAGLTNPAKTLRNE